MFNTLILNAGSKITQSYTMLTLNTFDNRLANAAIQECPQEYFQPDIGIKIRIFSLGRKNNILILKIVYMKTAESTLNSSRIGFTKQNQPLNQNSIKQNSLQFVQCDRVGDRRYDNLNTWIASHVPDTVFIQFHKSYAAIIFD